MATDSLGGLARPALAHEALDDQFEEEEEMTRFLRLAE